MGIENFDSTVKTPVGMSALRDTLVVVGTGACGFIARWNAKLQLYQKPSLFRVNKEGFLNATLFGEKPLLAVVTADFVVKIFDTEKNSCISTLTANKQESCSVVISDSSGQLSIGGKEGLLLVYDSRNLGFQPKKMEIDKTGQFGVSTLCHNTEGNKLAIGLQIWAGPLSSPSGSISRKSLSSSSSASLLSPSPATPLVPIKVYNMEKYTLELEWKAHSKDITELQWFGGLIASCAQSEVPHCINLWNETNGEKVMSISLPSPLRAFRFDPFSRGFIAASEGGLVTCKMSIMSTEEKEKVKQLRIQREEDEKLRLQKEEERKQKRREMQKGGVKFESRNDNGEEGEETGGAIAGFEANEEVEKTKKEEGEDSDISNDKSDNSNT